MFYFKKQPDFYTGPKKIWSHRGWVRQGARENTLKSVRLAVEKGFPGVEVDMFYDSNSDELVINHDAMRIDPDRLTLDKLLSDLESRPKLWLDMKNVSSENVIAVRERILTVIKDRVPLKDVIIEHKDPKMLRRFSEVGLPTSYWLTKLRFSPSKNPLINIVRWILWWKQELTRRYYVATEDFNAVSQGYKEYEHYLKDTYSHLNIHLWINKSNSREVHERLLSDPAVKIVLSDFHSDELE